LSILPKEITCEPGKRKRQGSSTWQKYTSPNRLRVSYEMERCPSWLISVNIVVVLFQCQCDCPCCRTTTRPCRRQWRPSVQLGSRIIWQTGAWHWWQPVCNV